MLKTKGSISKIKDTIIEVQKFEVCQKTSKHYGQICWLIKGIKHKIKVIKDLVKDKKFYAELEKGKLVGKTFIFSCLKHGNSYRMIEAQEAKNILDILEPRNSVLGDTATYTWIGSDPNPMKGFKLDYSSYVKDVNIKKIALAEKRAVYKKTVELAKMSDKILGRSICNLAEYDPKNIYFENDIWDKYDGENTPWIKKQAGKNKDKILIYNPAYCLSDFPKWEPLFKGVVLSTELINEIQLIIIPQRDVIFKSGVIGEDKKDAYWLGVNYANALAVVEFEDNFKKRQKPCESCAKIFVPHVGLTMNKKSFSLYNELMDDDELTLEQKARLKVLQQEEFEQELCFKCQSRWLKSIGGLTVIKFPKWVKQG